MIGGGGGGGGGGCTGMGIPRGGVIACDCGGIPCGGILGAIGTFPAGVTCAAGTLSLSSGSRSSGK